MDTTRDTTRGNTGREKNIFVRDEAQMIMCILIIYPLAVSVHLMNDFLLVFALHHFIGCLKAPVYFFALFVYNLVIKLLNNNDADSIN